MKFLYPGHNYLGPGNSLQNGTPVDRADNIARVHDYDYFKAKTKQDIFRSDLKAIKEFKADYTNKFNLPSWVGEKGLIIKHGFEKAINKTVYPFNLPSGDAREGNSQSAVDTTESLPIPSDSDFNASTMADTTNVGTGEPQGGGSAAHSLHGQTANIFNGSAQNTNSVTFTYKKTYRWFAYTEQPAIRKNPETGNPEFRIGSALRIPVEHLGWYCSPEELFHIRKYERAEVISAGCKIYNYGIRLPFRTNESNSVVANASAQYPLCQWIGLEKAYNFANNPPDMINILERCRGDTLNPQTPTWNTNVKNWSSRTTSRIFDNYAVMTLPGYSDNYYQPNVNEFAQSINGTMNLGLVFEWGHTCQNGVIHQKPGNEHHIGKNPNIYQFDVAPVAAAMHPNTDTAIDNANSKKIAASRDRFEGLNAHGCKANFEHALIDGWQYYSKSTPMLHNTKIKPFIVGMQHLMNEDKNNEVLRGCWEFATECWITIKCKKGAYGIYHHQMDSDAMNYNKNPLQTMDRELRPTLQISASDGSIVQSKDSKKI